MRNSVCLVKLWRREGTSPNKAVSIFSFPDFSSFDVSDFCFFKARCLDHISSTLFIPNFANNSGKHIATYVYQRWQTYYLWSWWCCYKYWDKYNSIRTRYILHMYREHYSAISLYEHWEQILLVIFFNRCITLVTHVIFSLKHWQHYYGWWFRNRASQLIIYIYIHTCTYINSTGILRNNCHINWFNQLISPSLSIFCEATMKLSKLCIYIWYICTYFIL